MTLRWFYEAKNAVIDHSSQIDVTTLVDVSGYIAGGTIAMFATKTLVTAVARAVGVSHPHHYRYWPRLPWRGPYRIYIAIKQWHERVFRMKQHATGGLAGVLATQSQIYKPGMLLLGRSYAWGLPLMQPIGGKIERHCMIYSMSGGGKTTLLISMIGCWIGSVFVIDPKAQITIALADYDSRTWYVFDPHGISGRKSISINVFDVMIAAMEEQGEDAAVLWAIRIAEAIIVTPEGSRSPFFYDTARGFLVGVILHVYTSHDKECWNLPFVRDLIKTGYRVFNEETGEEETTPEEAFALLIRAMLNNLAFEGIIAAAAANLSSAGKETLGNILATLLDQTRWLDIPSVRAVLLKSDIDLRDLKRRDDIVFSFVATVFSLREELKSLARLIINMTAYTFEYVKTKKGQCLMVVDELPSMGYNATIEILLAVFRSMGISFVAISQDIELHQKAYPKSWRAFSGNADFVICMASNEKETTSYFSQLLGKTTLIQQDRYSGRKSYREVPVLDDDQIRRLLSPESGRMLVMRAGKRAMILMNEPYFKALPVWKYAPDPDHGDRFLRGISRSLFDRKAHRPSVISNEQHDCSNHSLPHDQEEIPYDHTSENIIPFKKRP